MIELDSFSFWLVVSAFVLLMRYSILVLFFVFVLLYQSQPAIIWLLYWFLQPFVRLVHGMLLIYSVDQKKILYEF